MPKGNEGGGMKNRALPRWLSVLFLVLAVLAPRLWAQAPPCVSLKDAVAVGEDALKANQVDADQYFLFSVVLTHSSSGDCWYCTFRPAKADKKAGGYGAIYVKVYMDSTAEVVMPEIPIRYR